MVISGVSGRRIKGKRGVGWIGVRGVEGEERALGQFQHSVFGHFVDAGAWWNRAVWSRLWPKVRLQTRSEACFSAHDDRIGACRRSYFFGVASVSLASAYD